MMTWLVRGWESAGSVEAGPYDGEPPGCFHRQGTDTNRSRLLSPRWRSPDGKRLALATGSWLPDGTPGEIKLWDVATGKESLPGQATHDGSALVFTGRKDARFGQKNVKLWDVATERSSGIPVKGAQPGPSRSHLTQDAGGGRGNLGR